MFEQETWLYNKTKIEMIESDLQHFWFINSIL